jgi:hypothetical protein
MVSATTACSFEWLPERRRSRLPHEVRELSYKLRGDRDAGQHRHETQSYTCSYNGERLPPTTVLVSGRSKRVVKSFPFPGEKPWKRPADVNS